MRRANIVRDFAAEILRIGSMLVLGLVLTPILFRELGESTFGMWKFLQTVMFFVIVAEPALRGAMARFLAEAIGQNDVAKASRIVSTTTVVLLPLIGVAAAIAALIAPYLVASTADKADPLFHEGVTALRVLALASLLSSAFGILASILHAMRRIDLANVVGIPILWLRVVSLITVALSGGGLVALAWTSVAVTAVGLVVQGAFVARVLRGRGILAKALLKPGRVEGLWRFVGFSACAKIGDVLRSHSTMVFIAMAGSLEAAAIYGLVGTLQAIGTQALVGLADTASPRMARVASRKHELRPMIASLGAMLGSMSAVTAFGLLLIGVPFIQLWAAPDDQAGVLGPFVQLLALTIVVNAGRMMVGRSLRAQNKVGYLASGQLIEGIVVAGLGYWLMSSLGVIGPLVARVSVSAAYLLVAVPLLFRRVSLIEHRDYFFGCYLRPLLAAAIGAIPLALGTMYLRLDSWPMLVLVGAVGGGILAGVVYRWGLGATTRAEIMMRVKDIRGR